MDELRAFFNDSKELSEKEMGFLVNHFDKVKVKKGTVLFEEGAIVSSIYFVAQGVLHHFNYNELGEKKTLDLHDGPCFCTDLESFSEGKRSQDSCVALTDCTVYILSKTKYDSLVNTNVKWSNFAKRIVERTLIKMLDQLKAMSNKSIEERYLDLLRTKPSIIQSASIGVIASYLGTSRETLHRIRRKHILA